MSDNTTDNRPKCGCGKSLNMPYCDGSHGRTPEQYAAYQKQIEAEKAAQEKK